MPSWTSKALLLVGLYAPITLASASPLKLDFKKEKRSSFSKRASGFVNAPLLEGRDHVSDYYINLTIGTPPQPISVVLDTGSSDLVVVSSAAENEPVCASFPDSPGCAAYGVYDKRKSTSYHPIPEIQGSIELLYGSTTSYGTIGREKIHLEHLAIPNMTFYDVDEPGVPYGIWGIGYPAAENLASRGYQVPTITDHLVELGYIHRKAFSLYLDDQDAGTGSIIFGGIDSSKYTGDLITVPVTPVKEQGISVYLVWRIPLTSISFHGANGSTILTPPDMATPGVLDSGTSSIFLPEALAKRVYAGLGAVEFTIDGVTAWAADCSYVKSNASLSFQFGGSKGPTIHVPVGQILGDIPIFAFGNGVPACLVQIGASMETVTEEAGGLLLGDPLMRNAYIVYDLENNEISLAQAKFNQRGTSHIQAIPRGSGLPGVKFTATVTATQLPIPTNTAVQSDTAGFISQGRASSTGIPQSASTAKFSLGVSAPTTGGGAAGRPTDS